MRHPISRTILLEAYNYNAKINCQLIYCILSSKQTKSSQFYV